MKQVSPFANDKSLYLMMTITERVKVTEFITLYKNKNVDVHFIALGYGTADEQLLRRLAIDGTEKAVCYSVVTGEKWAELKRGMSNVLHIEAPGVGIACISPLSSIGGKRELAFLTDKLGYEKGEESTMKGTEQDLLIVISNQGYNEQVMDAAREVGARGGTIIHARGTGMNKAEKFLGISLASEKDVIYIVTPTEKKTEIMQAIMHKAGPETPAGAVCFSVPVSDTAGMNLHPEE